MPELENLKSRLASLGVHVKESVAPTSTRTVTTPGDKAKKASLVGLDPQGKPEVAHLLDKINRVEAALNMAEGLTGAALSKVDAELERAVEHSSPKRKSTVKKRILRPKSAKPAATTPSTPGVTATNPMVRARSSTCVRRSVDVGRDRIPAHTPLASVLSQYRESETIWAQEKALLRREADTHRRRANHLDEELKRLSRLSEHRSLDIKALKTALRNRDNQLVECGERLKEMEGALEKYQEDAAVRLAALSTERDDLKALLIATLQRLEAVDEVVHRADVSSSIMAEKVKQLEDEKLQALEAAAVARAEVAELTESRRKLQWQSKLLEKMSEVQLKHNKHKTEAIKKLLSDPPPGGQHAEAAVGMHADAGGDDSSPDLSRQARANHRSHVTFLEQMTRNRLDS